LLLGNAAELDSFAVVVELVVDHHVHLDLAGDPFRLYVVLGEYLVLDVLQQLLCPLGSYSFIWSGNRIKREGLIPSRHSRALKGGSFEGSPLHRCCQGSGDHLWRCRWFGEPLDEDSRRDRQPLGRYLRQPICDGVLPAGDVFQLEAIEMVLEFSHFIHVCPHLWTIVGLVDLVDNQLGVTLHDKARDT
jgi:hypothetical protein